MELEFVIYKKNERTRYKIGTIALINNYRMYTCIVENYLKTDIYS